MTVPSYTEEDVDLLAQKIHAVNCRSLPIVHRTVNPSGACEDARHLARVALDDLAAAGRLVPPGSETREEWGVCYVRRTDGDAIENAAEHRAMAEGWVDFANERVAADPDSWLLDASLIRRRVITTPWSPSVPDTKEET